MAWRKMSHIISAGALSVVVVNAVFHDLRDAELLTGHGGGREEGVVDWDSRGSFLFAGK